MLLVRKAKLSDLELYYQWVNDPIVRTNSLSCSIVSKKNHYEWFVRKLADDHSYLYIFEKEEIPIGQVRFDSDLHKAKINYSICSGVRGSGFGTLILQKAISHLINDCDEIEELLAVVKKSNIASNKVFKRLGFTIVEDKVTKELISYQRIMSRLID